MPIWDFFRPSKPPTGLAYFTVTFAEDQVFGVTAATAQDAEALVCTEIFHDQTIPGLPTVEAIDAKTVRERFPGVASSQLQQVGIWHR